MGNVFIMFISQPSTLLNIIFIIVNKKFTTSLQNTTTLQSIGQIDQLIGTIILGGAGPISGEICSKTNTWPIPNTEC